MKAIRIHQHGGPDVLCYEDCPPPQPGPGQALIDIQAIGVNFVDTYIRSGLYQSNLPTTLGNEAAGVVSSVGEGVTEVAVGDMVACADVRGAYAEQAVAPAVRLVKLPPGIDANVGTAVMLQGTTAHFLAHSAFPLKPGDKALIHAGAGGVGLLLIQIAKKLGAYVFTTVSTPEKAKLAADAGADKVILYTSEDFEEAIERETDGKGVQVVYDSVGKTTFDKSLRCLETRGYLILFGQSSGPVPSVDPLILRRGSLFLTRPSLNDYIATREDLLWRAGDLFQMIESGELRVRLDKTFPLAEAADAHRALESRSTAGKVLLTP